MLALTILLFGLLIMLVMVVVLLLISNLAGLLSLVIPVMPMLMMIGSGMLSLIELLLFLGGPEDRRLAIKDLKYLGTTFIISGALWWISTHFLWQL
ncbi:MAG: hypothetical protein HYX78_13360 [Armatimonadetes bacterium]|nr:hypothetical protein [Armatimonadota bacterium]